MSKIYQHSCEQMPELENDTVALTVTSPPYWNAIDYDIHAADKSQHFRTRAYNQGFLEYEEYLEWLERIFSEVLRVTIDGGFCSIVIGTVLFNRKHYPVPFDLVPRMINCGWDFHQDIIWHKCTAGVKRAGVAIQKPYPGYFYPNIMTEYILIFRKPGTAIYSRKNSEEKTLSKYPINKLFTMDIANNLWHIAPVPPNYIDHPAPFPEEIPHRLISLYSYLDDLILDPFMGSGQTLKVANALGRRYIGYEIIEKYASLAQQRIQEPLGIREEQLVAVFDKVPFEEPIGNSVENSRKPRRRSGRQRLEKSQPALFPGSEIQ